MASAGYNFGREEFLNGNIDMNTDAIQFCLVDDTYTFVATQTTMTTPGLDRLGTDDVALSPTITDGVFDATDGSWIAVAGGATIHGVVVYKFVTNDAGSTPIVFIDLTNTATNGGDITIQWDAGANKIFAING